MDYRGFTLKQLPSGRWIVLAPDGEKLSSPLQSVTDAQRFVDRHIRMGGK